MLLGASMFVSLNVQSLRSTDQVARPSAHGERLLVVIVDDGTRVCG